MDLKPSKFVSISPFRPLHLSPRDGDHSRFFPTYSEFAGYGDKVFFVPEPGIARSLCFGDSRSPKPDAKLELIFVGGLVARKACDLALRAAAPLLRSGARFTVVGDGPERDRLEQ